jgi:acetyl esterase/lipase
MAGNNTRGEVGDKVAEAALGRLGIEPDVIIVTGESSGAHIPAMIALSSGVADLEGTVKPWASSDVAEAVLFYGPYDFNTIVDEALEILLAGKCRVELNPLPVWALLGCPLPGSLIDPFSECEQPDLVEASPVTHVDSGDPPVFIAAGKNDCYVPWMQALDLEGAQEPAGVRNQVSTTEDGEHDADTLDVTSAQLIDFLSAGAS